jgi:hypothetical protein
VALPLLAILQAAVHRGERVWIRENDREIFFDFPTYSAVNLFGSCTL